jgi:hypothetical protein
MDLGGLGAILQAVQAKKQALTVRVYNTQHVLLATFEALGNTTLSMLYSLVGRAIAMQGFSILRTDNQMLTHIEPFGHLDVVVDAFGVLASMYKQGRTGSYFYTFGLLLCVFFFALCNLGRCVACCVAFVKSSRSAHHDLPSSANKCFGGAWKVDGLGCPSI